MRCIVFTLLFALLTACEPAELRSIAGEGGVLGPPEADPDCSGDPDADGDGIPDEREGRDDLDGDGIPNREDEDSDGDGLLDRDEAGPDPCNPISSDADGEPDFLDVDSDDDGLTDDREVELGTDPGDQDSDDDGVSDLGEVEGTGTDPNDPTEGLRPGDFFVVLPYEGPRENRSLVFGTDIAIADVFFLVDMTGSMQGERTNLIGGLLDVVIPGIEGAIDDVHFGVGGMDDYPYAAEGRTPYGDPRDLPFYLLRDIGPPDADVGRWSLEAGPERCPNDVTDGSDQGIGTIEGMPNGTPDILEAVEGLPCHFGADFPESYVPALYATASGEGLSWPMGSIPARVCPPTGPDTDGSFTGYPCFRPGALPIVLLFGDAPFHDGPGGSNAYSFDSPSFDEAVAALNGIGARVVPIFSGGAEGQADYRAIATATGSVDVDDEPLFFQIASDGSGLDTTVVEAVRDLVGGTPQDVSTRTENVPGNPDDVDATRFIERIVPLGGFPVAGFERFDESAFYRVIPGTQVEFGVDFYNGVRPPTDKAEIFEARIVVVGNGVADLDSRNVYVVVPPEGTIILI
ncbi:MAG: hypothetical protein AAGH15_14220 [Myxococcota bacterium]